MVSKAVLAAIILLVSPVRSVAGGTCDVPIGMTTREKLPCVSASTVLLEQPSLTIEQLAKGPDFDAADPVKSRFAYFTPEDTISCYFRPFFAFLPDKGRTPKFLCWQLDTSGKFFGMWPLGAHRLPGLKVGDQIGDLRRREVLQQEVVPPAGSGLSGVVQRIERKGLGCLEARGSQQPVAYCGRIVFLADAVQIRGVARGTVLSEVRSAGRRVAGRGLRLDGLPVSPLLPSVVDVAGNVVQLAIAQVRELRHRRQLGRTRYPGSKERGDRVTVGVGADQH